MALPDRPSFLNELRARRRRPKLLGMPDTAAQATDETTLASLAVAAALAELPPWSCCSCIRNGRERTGIRRDSSISVNTARALLRAASASLEEATA